MASTIEERPSLDYDAKAETIYLECQGQVLETMQQVIFQAYSLSWTSNPTNG